MLGHAEEAAVWGAEAVERFPLWPWVMRDANVVQHIRYNRPVALCVRDGAFLPGHGRPMERWERGKRT